MAKAKTVQGTIKEDSTCKLCGRQIKAGSTVQGRLVYSHGVPSLVNAKHVECAKAHAARMEAL